MPDTRRGRKSAAQGRPPLRGIAHVERADDGLERGILGVGARGLEAEQATGRVGDVLAPREQQLLLVGAELFLQLAVAASEFIEDCKVGLQLPSILWVNAGLRSCSALVVLLPSRPCQQPAGAG